jgi:hypothetical protein
LGLQLPHLSLLTAFEAKADSNLITLSDPQFGQGAFAVEENSNSSNCLSQSLHKNSNIGISGHLEYETVAPTATPSKTAGTGLHIIAQVDPA